MKYTVHIQLQKDKDTSPYMKDFEYEGSGDDSVAMVLRKLNSQLSEEEQISWECGCMVRKCGACSMIINGRPSLACSTFLDSIQGNDITLEPLSKFPVVKDLIVDRSIIFENLQKASLWLEGQADMDPSTHAVRYKSASCIMCGCCLEVCPNFTGTYDFAGAVDAVNAFRILNEESTRDHKKEVAKKYRKQYFRSCGKSLSCHDICPIGLPIEELVARSNAAAVWHR